jgi:hypothetical protein
MAPPGGPLVLPGEPEGGARAGSVLAADHAGWLRTRAIGPCCGDPPAAILEPKAGGIVPRKTLRVFIVATRFGPS